MDERDLPEGVMNANPPGAWEGGDSADAETAQQSRDASGSDELTDSGFPSTASGGDAPAAPPESPDANRGVDPDLSTDEED